MRRCLGIIALVVCIVTINSAVVGQEKKDPLAPGSNIPATFHPYNVTVATVLSEEPDDGKGAGSGPGIPRTKYTTKGKYHCLITDYNLDPVVMLIARDLEDNAAFTDFLKKLSGVVDRNRSIRLRAFVVYLSDELDNILKDDKSNKDLKDERFTKRKELVAKIEKVGNELNRSQVVLTLGSKPDLAKYGLQDGIALTAVLYRNLRIVSTHRLTKDKIVADGPALQAILADVADKFKAK